MIPHEINLRVPRIASERRSVRLGRTSSASSRPGLSSEPSLTYWRPLSCPGMDPHSNGNAAAPPWYTSSVSFVSVNTAESSTEGGKGGVKHRTDDEEDEDDEEKLWWWLEKNGEDEERLDREGPQVSMKLGGDTEDASLSGSKTPAWHSEVTPLDIAGSLILPDFSLTWCTRPLLSLRAKVSVEGSGPPPLIVVLDGLHAGVTSTSLSSDSSLITQLTAWAPSSSSGAGPSLLFPFKPLFITLHC